MKLLFSLKFHQEKIMHWLFWEWNSIWVLENLSAFWISTGVSSQCGISEFLQDAVLGGPSRWVLMLFSGFLTFVRVQSLSHVWFFVTPWTRAHQASLSFTVFKSLPNSCPLSQWCHPTISSSVTPFSSCPQSSPASGSFPLSWLFASGGQSIGASASVSPMNVQDWSPVGLTGLLPLLSKGSRESSPAPHLQSINSFTREK